MFFLAALSPKSSWFAHVNIEELCFFRSRFSTVRKTTCLVFGYVLVSENIAISCYHDSVRAQIRLVCFCATQIFILKHETFPICCADLFKSYSLLPAKPTYKLQSYWYYKYFKITKTLGTNSHDKFLSKAASQTYINSGVYFNSLVIKELFQHIITLKPCML